jgi:hypothetical protein
MFPAYGRRMLSGHLRALGHKVPDPRLRDSYLRVHGIPATFGDCAIHRQKYSVPGANSLWHHDGQHGMYHCFIYIPTFQLIPLRTHSIQDCYPLLY